MYSSFDRLECMRCVCLLLLAALSLAAAKKPVSIGDVLEMPRTAPIEPVWSPDGKAFAYSQNGTIYRWRRGDGKPASWLSLSSLEAEPAPKSADPQPFNWTNRHVSDERMQWFPNSRDLLLNQSGRLFILPESGSPRRLTLPHDATQPQLSPDGERVLYQWHNNLFVSDLKGQETTQLTQDGSETLWNGRLDWVYPEELELDKAAWWSPDSKTVAYLQFNVADEFVYPQANLLGERALAEPERYPQAGTPNARVRLGLVSVSGGQTVWAKAGDSPDVLMARVYWLPDSSSVALETAPRIQNELTLWFCNPQTGDLKKVLQESSKTWINITDNLRFLKTEKQFLWTSERSGYRHLYLYSDSGDQVAQLTSGDWEVRGIAAVDEGKRLVYYLSSQDSPLETQLYEAPLAGGGTKRITAAGFDHDMGVEPNGDMFLDEASNLTTPPETTLRDMDGQSVRVLQPRDTGAQSKYQLSVPELMKVKAGDGTELYGLLFKPVGYEAGKRYPLIVDVYGGPQAQSVRNAWPGVGMDQVYTSSGYAVWKLDNRGSYGRGHRFEEAVFRNLGSVEVKDQRAGVQYLIAKGIVDRNRVGVSGWSFGGYMTIRCLLLAPDVFKTGVAGAPVTDWHNYDTIYTERYMGLPAQNVSGYEASSNVAAAENLAGKLLIQHNLEDDNVLFQNTMQMVNALEEEKKEYVLQLYPLHTHGVSGDLREPLYAEALKFFSANLR